MIKAASTIDDHRVRADGRVHTTDGVVDRCPPSGNTQSIMSSRVTYAFVYFADTEKVGAVGG